MFSCTDRRRRRPYSSKQALLSGAMSDLKPEIKSIWRGGARFVFVCRAGGGAQKKQSSGNTAPFKVSAGNVFVSGVFCLASFVGYNISRRTMRFIGAFCLRFRIIPDQISVIAADTLITSSPRAYLPVAGLFQVHDGEDGICCWFYDLRRLP